MSAVVADTHALVWFLFEQERLSPAAAKALDAAVEGPDAILVSAISLVELTYLVEKGRLPVAVLARVVALADSASGLSIVPVDAAVARAVAAVLRTEVPDLPDRIIAATAVHMGVPLVSRDHKIMASCVRTIW